MTGAERRRRWSGDRKRAIVAAAFSPGAVVADVARRADVCTSLIYRWRREFRAEQGGFTEMVVVSDPSGVGPASGFPVIELDFGGKVTVRISALASPALASAMVGALGGR